MDIDDAVLQISAYTIKHEDIIHKELQSFVLHWLNVNQPVASSDDMLDCNGYLEAKLSAYFEQYQTEVWAALGHQQQLIHTKDILADWWAKTWWNENYGPASS